MPSARGGLGAVAAARLERREDVLALHLGERRAARRRRRWRGCAARPARPADGQRQVLGADRRAVAEHHGALDAVLQLAHVAGPAVRARAAPRPRPRARARGLPCLRAVERRGSARASRAMSSAPRSRSGGSDDLHHLDAVVEVLAERAARRPSPRGRGGSRRPRARRRVMRPRAADALELAVLQEAQELALQRQRQLADLVEEERAAVRRPRTCPMRARRRR